MSIDTIELKEPKKNDSVAQRNRERTLVKPQ